MSADIPALLGVFFHAVEDLDARRGRSPQPRAVGPLQMHFEHLLSTDPASSLLVEDHGRIIAFGIVMRRGDQAFLSFLFVEPGWQHRGIGRSLFDACVDGAGPVSAIATHAEADQPVSTGLYASLGLAPRSPVYLLRGALAEGALPGLPAGLDAVPVDHVRVAGLDRQLLGYERPVDHALWASDRRLGLMFVTGQGEVLGYGYAHPAGRIGPVAAAAPAQLPGFIGHLAGAMPVLDGRQIVVPGPSAALRPLLGAGIRIDGTPAVYCSAAAPPAFDRYVPMSFALL